MRLGEKHRCVSAQAILLNATESIQWKNGHYYGEFESHIIEIGADILRVLPVRADDFIVFYQYRLLIELNVSTSHIHFRAFFNAEIGDKRFFG